MKIATRTEDNPNLYGDWTFSSKNQTFSDNREKPDENLDILSKVVMVIAPAECISILGSILNPLKMDMPAALIVAVNGLAPRGRPLPPNLNKARFPAETGTIGTRIRNGHATIVQSDENLILGANDCLEAGDGGFFLDSVVRRFGRETVAVVLTELSEPEKKSIEAVRAAGGRVIALDDTDRGWLHENAPKVTPGPGDTCLIAEKIGDEISTMIKAHLGIQ